MDEKQSIEKSFRLSTVIIFITNTLAAILFFVAYAILKNWVFLLLAGLMIVSCVGFYYFLNYFKNKILGKM